MKKQQFRIVINTRTYNPCLWNPFPFFHKLVWISSSRFQEDFSTFQIQISDMDGSISPIIRRYAPGDKSNLIPILQEVQKKEGYLKQETVDRISAHLKISSNHVYGVASFYSQFKFNPPGRNSIRICLGTACHVQGGDFLLSALKSEIGISPNETTEDGKFDLERVACLGCCALAPVIMINDVIFSNMSVVKMKELLEKYE
jgi:NADH-quinone oxidoreductase subunit E